MRKPPFQNSTTPISKDVRCSFPVPKRKSRAGIASRVLPAKEEVVNGAAVRREIVRHVGKVVPVEIVSAVAVVAVVVPPRTVSKSRPVRFNRLKSKWSPPPL